MNIQDLEVVKGLVAQKNTKTPQMIQVTISTEDINTGVAQLTWQNVGLMNGAPVDEQPFATATVGFGDSKAWLSSWLPYTHLVRGRIEALAAAAAANNNTANCLSHNMAYRLFASNLVDYAPKYRGMQSVVIDGLEAFADVTLTTESAGTWTVAPYFIDSVAHLAGFVMNVSDAMDTAAKYCVTPGWRSMRFAKPLVAGTKYRSYVKMIPTAEDPTVYLGDVYILQDDVIIGLVGGIQFRSYPRILLNRFFSAPDEVSHGSSAAPATAVKKPAIVATKPATSATVKKPKTVVTTVSVSAEDDKVKTPTKVSIAVDPLPSPPSSIKEPPTATQVVEVASDSIAAKAVGLIAREAGLDTADFEDSASFAELGIDSLMSLVISEKFREELGVSVSGSLFLEYPTIGDLRSWLLEYYS